MTPGNPERKPAANHLCYPPQSEGIHFPAGELANGRFKKLVSPIVEMI